MIAHLRGREEVMTWFGWTRRHAEWIALVGLTGGYFTRAQLCDFLGVAPLQARKVVRMMTERKIATEGTLEARRVCRISGQGIYQALGAPDLRPPGDAAEETVMRRLLSLDYVLDHTGLPWLPTETEKVGAFEALGIARELLPRRRTGGYGRARLRYFADELPIALDDGRALFTFADPGFASSGPLREWGKKHCGLWQALREGGRAVHVVAVVRTVRELRRARATVTRWSRPGSAPSGAAGENARREIERIKRAILEGDGAALAPYGDIQAGLGRIAELRELERSARPRPSIDGLDTWRSSRLPGEWS